MRVRTLAEVRARYAVIGCGWDGAHPVPEGAPSCSCGMVTRHAVLRPAATQRDTFPVCDCEGGTVHLDDCPAWLDIGRGGRS